MRAPFVGVALLTVCLPAFAVAQSLPLTESEALARLSPDSPRLRALRAGVEVAKAEVLSAARWPNPRFTFDREAVAGVTENITTIGQPLPITGRRGLDVRATSALADAASSRADDTIRRARTDLRMVFAQLVAAQTREQEIGHARARLAEVVQILTNRENAGDAAGYDRIRAERELADLDADAAAAAVDRARAQAALSGFFVGVAPNSLMAVAATRPHDDMPAIDTLVARAEANRGELVALQHEVAAARFAAQSADRRWIPEPEIVAGTKSSSANGGDIGGVVGVQATLPLFDRGRPERGAAKAREQQADARIDAYRLTLRSEIAVWRETVVLRRQAADRYRESALRSVDQIERIARVSYDAGEGGILELLDAFRIGIAAAARQASLDAAVREAEIELDFVSGWEMP